MEVIMNETWKTITLFPNYEVSNFGNIRNRYGKILKQQLNKYGRLFFRPVKDGKPITKEVHRFVAEAFLEDWDPNLTVDHIDGDPTNNNVNNLQMLEQRKNNQKYFNEIGRKYKIIYQLDLQSGKLINTFNTPIEAVDYLMKKTNKTKKQCYVGIMETLSKKQSSFENYYWSDVLDIDLDNYKSRIRKKPVQQFTLDNVLIATYSSITEAANAVTPNGKSIQSYKNDIGLVCNNKKKFARGYIWKFISDLYE